LGEHLSTKQCIAGMTEAASTVIVDLDQTMDSTTPATDTPADNSSSILGNVFKQCSTARLAASSLIVTEIKNGASATIAATAPQIGRLDWEEDLSVLKTFHGGRVTKAGRTVNECLASSFDPRNLHCVSC
jgi:hypothetical protein